MVRSTNDKRQIAVGRFGAPYGVRGWIAVQSFTEPADNLFGYGPWQVSQVNSWLNLVCLDHRQHRRGYIVQLEGYSSPEAVGQLSGKDILVDRELLPPLKSGEFYRADLEGLTVLSPEGEELGQVDHVIETGANDVLAVKGKKEFCVPFLLDDVVLEVNLENQTITVDWDAE